MLLAAPEAIYTHFNISNGFFNSTYLMTPTPDPKTVSAPSLFIGSRAHAACRAKRFDFAHAVANWSRRSFS